MTAITRLEINGFKAFPKEFVLDLCPDEPKNLLLYGENGSGKSSIYYALHVLLQSSFKDDFGAKYFKADDETNNEYLVNLNRVQDVKDNTFSPYIKITLNNGETWRLDRDGLTSEHGTKIENFTSLNNEAIFINHSYISRCRTARNSEDIDLWDVFNKDILSFYRPEGASNFLSVIYDEIVEEASGIPNVNNKTFSRKIDSFNDALKNLIDEANTKISDIYNQNFRFQDDKELSIDLVYLGDADANNIHHESYYLFYGNKRHGKTIPKSLYKPKIGLSIKEGGQVILKPQTYFNEAKFTAIALAIRFACIQAPSGFIVLDDMLISLDMSNRMKIINYLLNVLSSNYKLYLFTHDRLFYASLKNRIKIDNSINNWIVGCIYMHHLDENFNSCIPYPVYIKDKDSLLTAQEYYICHDYPACGQALRKWCEKIFEILYPDTLKKKIDPESGKTTDNNLNDKIGRLKDFCDHEGFNFSNYKDLKIYKDDILNSVSHYDVSSPIYGDEILCIMQILSKLDKIASSKRWLKVNHELGIELTKPDSTRLTICIDIKSNKLAIIKNDAGDKISYYTSCLVKKIIDNGIHRDVDPAEKYPSIYEAYEYYCSEYHIHDRFNLLDIVYDHRVCLRDKL